MKPFYFSDRRVSDYLPSDSFESCLPTEASSSVLKLKADNNAWNCDCEMKVLFDYISKNDLAPPNLTCKGPSEYENLHWKVLKSINCSTPAAPVFTRMIEVPASVPKKTSSVTKAVIPNLIDKPRVNTTAPLSANSSEKMLIVPLLIPLLIVTFLCVVLSFFTCKRHRSHTGANARSRSNEHETTDLMSRDVSRNILKYEPVHINPSWRDIKMNAFAKDHHPCENVYRSATDPALDSSVAIHRPRTSSV